MVGGREKVDSEILGLKSGECNLQLRVKRRTEEVKTAEAANRMIWKNKGRQGVRGL